MDLQVTLDVSRVRLGCTLKLKHLAANLIVSTALPENSTSTKVRVRNTLVKIVALENSLHTRRLLCVSPAQKVELQTRKECESVRHAVPADSKRTINLMKSNTVVSSVAKASFLLLVESCLGKYNI